MAKLLPRRTAPQHEEELAAAVEELSRNAPGAEIVLAETLPFGVAYHHAGLTVRSRLTHTLTQGVSAPDGNEMVLALIRVVRPDERLYGLCDYSSALVIGHGSLT